MSEREIFIEALQKSITAEREEFLQQACAGDDTLRNRVEHLLAEHAKASSFVLDRPLPKFDETAAMPPIAQREGSQIGPYKLLQKLGEGGMGVVYMAEQREPVERRVAVKIVKPGMDTQQVIARFEAERQALAMMDHPNIARVLDASATDSGQPYFVMELVKGVPITDYCDRNKLTPRQRLELLLPVCQAIQHAHQKGIIHRDIKPSNIMVTLYDGRPVPKVIDFGVAKAIAKRLTEKTMFTQYGNIIGTFEYMSPEQAEMSALDVDTRSDVYSLGVLIYELLTGSTPITRQQIREAGLEEMLRMIREQEPERPSMRLSHSGDALPTISAQRHTEPAKLSALLRGELDWIVLKALEKDRTRRYESASSLGRDIERYLSDEPVEACPPSMTYRLRKFVHKQRGPVAAASAVFSALVIGLCVSLIMYWQAKEQQRAAVTARAAEAQKSEELADALEARSVALEQKTSALIEKDAALKEKNDALSDKNRALQSSESLRWVSQSTVQRNNPGLALLLAEAAARNAPVRLATHNNALLAALRACREIKAIRPPTPEGLGELDDAQVTSVTYSQDGTKFVTTSEARHKRAVKQESSTRYLNVRIGLAQVWSNDGKLLGTFQAPPDQQFAEVQLSPNGELLVGRFANSTVVHFQADSDSTEQTTRCLFSDRVARVWEVSTGEELYVLTAHKGPVTVARFSPDGARILTASWDGSARLWDASTGAQVGAVSTAKIAIEDANFNADGTRFFTVVRQTKRDARYPDSPGFEDPPHLVDPLQSDAPPESTIFQLGSGDQGRSSRSFSITATLDVPVVGEFKFKPGFTPRFLWDTETLNPVVDQDGRWLKLVDEMSSAAFTPDGQRLAVGTRSNQVILIDASTGEPKMEISTKGRQVTSIQFSRDGQRMLVRDEDRVVSAYGVDSGETLQSWTTQVPLRKAALSHDGTTVFVVHGMAPNRGEMYTGTEYDSPKHLQELKTVVALDVQTGAEVTSYRGHERAVFDVAESGDPKQLITVSRDGTMRIWSTTEVPHYGAVLAVGSRLRSASFNPDGSTVLIANERAYSKRDGADHFASLWDAETAQRIVKLEGAPGPEETPLTKYSYGGVKLAQFSPDGSRVMTVSDDRELKIIDPQIPANELFNKTEDEWPIAQTFPYTPVRVWDTTSGDQLLALKGLTSQVTWASFSPDGSRILTLSPPVRKYHHLLIQDGETRLDGNGSSRVNSDDYIPVHVCDAESGELLLTIRDLLNPHNDWEKPLAFDATGDWIVTTELWGAINFKDKERYTLPGVSTGSTPQFSPNGRHLLTTGWTRAVLLDLSTLQPPKGRSGGEVELTKFGPNGESQTTIIPHAVRRKCDEVALEGHVEPINSAAFSGDSQMIVTTSQDNAARIWNTHDGSLRHVLLGHQSAVKHAAFSPDGRYVVTASDDHTARIWETATGQEFFTLRGHTGPIRTVEFSPDGQHVLTASEDGTARLWPVDPLPVARARKPRELTAEERDRFAIPSP